jgi:cardiolipin synthase
MHFDFGSFQLLTTIGYIVDWVIRIVAIFVVPKDRKPSSATAWLMLIMFFPILGILIFLLIGSPKLSKRRRSMQRKIDEVFSKFFKDALNDKKLAQYVDIKIEEKIESIVKLNANLGGFPAFKGNKIKVIDNYQESINSIAKDISKASQFVHLEYFALCKDKKTNPIFQELQNAVDRRVSVRVMFDFLGSRKYPGFKKMKKQLTNIGVEWHPMLPLSLPGKNFNRPDLRNHRKIVVIDNKVAYTGSQNIIQDNYHRKDELYYEELVARVEGPIIMQLNAAFIADWFAETGTLLNHISEYYKFIQISNIGNTTAQVLPSGPGYDNSNNLKLFTGLIHSAKKRIVITNPYFVPDDSLITAITSAAQRNVEVVMINSEIMDQAMVGNAQRSFYEELLKAGVIIYMYKWPVLLHSKHMTIDDDIAVIGSSNLDMRSFQLDLEVTLVAYDKSVVKDLHKIQVKNIAKSSRLTLKEWQKRPLKSKLKENIARLTSAVQ